MRENRLIRTATCYFLVLSVFLMGNYIHISLPKTSVDSIEYAGCITFGGNNYNGVDYDVGDEPFSQLYSSYRNDQLDPNYPTPPYDPEITGFGNWQNDNYPFIGDTEIVDQVDGHQNVLESHASENGYMEGVNIPDSPSTGNQTIEFWWAWETVSGDFWGTTPRIVIQAENGFFQFIKNGETPENRWVFSSRDNDSITTLSEISTELTTDTIDPNTFYIYKFTFDMDNDIATYSIFGKQNVSGSISVPYDFGKIHWFSYGTGQNYMDQHWLDSLSWTWDDNYDLGDLLEPTNAQSPDSPIIWDYWYYFVIGLVAIGGIITLTVVYTKKKPKRGNSPPKDFGTLPNKKEVLICPSCGSPLQVMPNVTMEFCPYCGKGIS